ncbi:MAG TPA: hypothetical protein DDZ67_14695 [Xanthomonadaceae bacterium]|nr:hypothetical protein [Xanthomonadaceae bacterium]
MKTLHVAPLLAALLVGCSNAPQTFEIDNPTAAPLAVSIDGREHMVPAGESVPVTLSPGAHTLHADPVGEVNFIVYARANGGLINPTLGEYVVASQVYAADKPRLTNFTGSEDGVAVGDTVYQGAYRKSRDLIIGRSWAFGVHDAFPQQGVAHSGGKIFTASDFVDYAAIAAQKRSTFSYVANAVLPQPTYLSALSPTALPTLAPVFEAHAGELRDVFSGYVASLGNDPQWSLQSAQLAFARDTAMLSARQRAGGGDSGSRFDNRYDLLMGRSAIVLP